ncbi:MAG TPA: nitroreductase family protein [Fimbriimonas sp.]
MQTFLPQTRSKPAADAIRERVSIRRYTAQPVTDRELREVLELAGHAPSAFNLQPWRFVAVRSREDKDLLQKAAFDQPQVGSAPVVLALVSDMEDTMARLEETVHPGVPEEKRRASVEYLKSTYGNMSVEDRASWGLGQTYIALGYLLIALESLGFGSSPMLGFDDAQVKKLLGLPEHARIAALVAFGRPAEEGYPKHRFEVDSISRIVE